MRPDKFHGRYDNADRPCAAPGCGEPGEFRAPGERPPGFDGPGDWRWLCLDHVREFNSDYNYFEGMSADEISAAQNAYGGWDRETRAFGTGGGSPPPRWADFVDPLDAISARFRPQQPRQRADGRDLSQDDRKALRVLGLEIDADRRALRQRYLDLVRRYHPDKNGGDRSHEQRLSEVIESYQLLRKSAALA